MDDFFRFSKKSGFWNSWSTRKPRFPMDYKPLVKGRIANFGIFLDFLSFCVLDDFFCFSTLLWHLCYYLHRYLHTGFFLSDPLKKNLDCKKKMFPPLTFFFGLLPSKNNEDHQIYIFLNRSLYDLDSSLSL